jgi:hypothetical protein
LGEQRVKYTTRNEGTKNQVCGKTKQNKWKMKNGSAMARRPVMSTAEGEEPTSVEVVTLILSTI